MEMLVIVFDVERVLRRLMLCVVTKTVVVESVFFCVCVFFFESFEALPVRYV